MTSIILSEGTPQVRDRLRPAEDLRAQLQSRNNNCDGQARLQPGAYISTRKVEIGGLPDVLQAGEGKQIEGPIEHNDAHERGLS